MRYRFGPFQLDTLTAQLCGPDGHIALRPMSLHLLQVLIEQAPNVQSHEQLLDRVWGRQEVSAGVVSQSIRELRRALDDSVAAPRYIETRHRLGYRFIAAVEIEPVAENPAAAGPESRSDAAAPLASAAATPPGSRAPGLWLGLGLATAIGIGGWLLGQQAADADRADAYSGEEVIHDGRPHDPVAAAHYVQALRALRDQDLQAARSGFESVLAREPNSVAAMAALADTLSRAGEIDSAREWAASALAAAEGLPRIEHLRLQALDDALAYRWPEAIRTLQAVFELQPGDIDAGFRLFDAQIAAGDSAAAAATLTELETSGSPRLQPVALALARARTAALGGNHAERLTQGSRAEQQASAQRPRVDAILEQAWAHMLLGSMELVERDLQRVNALLADDPWPAAAMRVAMLGGTLERERGRYDAALDAFANAGSRAQALGNRTVAAAARREAAYVLYQAGRLPEAREQLAALEAEVTRLGELRELGSTLDVASLVEQRSGSPDAARSLSERALQAYLSAGDRPGEAAVRSNLGMLNARAGRFEEARQEMETSLALFRAHGDRRGAAIALGNLAAVHARLGRAAAAREANEAALQAFRELGSTLDVARLQFNLALEDRRAGRLAETEARFREALSGFTEVGAADVRLQVIASLAELLLQRAEFEAAATLLDGSGDIDTAEPQRRAAIETARARLAALRGDLESARSGFLSAMELRAAAGLNDWVRVSELDLAELAARSGLLVEAERAALGVRRQLKESGDVGAAVQAGLLLAATRQAQGERIDAVLDELESELEQVPEAALRLRLDIMRAAARGTQRAEALFVVAADARSMGFELLALRADLLAGGDAANSARQRLSALGVALEGVPPGLPF